MGSIASLSEKLRRERELRGVSLKQISEDTKIGVRFLEALEEGAIERIPGEFYRRSYLRAYARYLGLDEERAVNVYTYSQAEPGQSAAEDAAASEIPSWLRWGLGAAVLIVPAFLLLRSSGAPEDPRAGGTETATATATATASPSDAQRERGAEGANESPPPGSEAGLGPRAEPASASEEAAVRRPGDGLPSFPTARAESAGGPPPGVSVQSGDGLSFVLTVDESCWLEIMADGDVVVSGLKEAGFRSEFVASDEVRLWLGNAGGVRFWVNGQAMRPLGASGQVRKDVMITRTNYSEFVSTPNGTL